MTKTSTAVDVYRTPDDDDLDPVDTNYTSDDDDLDAGQRKGVPRRFLDSGEQSADHQSKRLRRTNIDLFQDEDDGTSPLTKPISSQNPFAACKVIDCIDFCIAADDSDASDIDEEEIAAGYQLPKTFTEDAILDNEYLRCVRRVLEDLHMNVSPRCKANEMQYLNVCEQHEKMQQQLRVKKIRDEYPTASDEEKANLIEKWENERLDLFTKADPHYDTWGVLRGVCRDVFPVKELLTRYPSLKTKIRDLRQRLNIRLRTTKEAVTERTHVS